MADDTENMNMETVRAVARHFWTADFMERNPGSTQKDADAAFGDNAQHYRRVAQRAMKRMAAKGIRVISA